MCIKERVSGARLILDVLVPVDSVANIRGGGQ